MPTTEPLHTGDDAARLSHPALRRSLVWGAWAALGLAVIGGGVGFLTGGVPALLGAVIGTLVAVFFMAITAASLLWVNRRAGRENYVVVLAAVVMGGWFVKFIAFVAVLVLLRQVPGLNQWALYLSVIAGVLVSLVVDILSFAKSRTPYVGDVALPKPAPGLDGSGSS
ncbi:MAG TPA: hypothetical protein VFU07_03450 [Candidatus Lumbricidophila sp.]|nr:hypothetical protein [Candidatus Lumbricidophila sp.]